MSNHFCDEKFDRILVADLMSLIFCISIGLTFVWIYIFWSQLKRFNPDIGLMRLIYFGIYSSLSQLAITSFMANSLIESSELIY